MAMAMAMWFVATTEVTRFVHPTVILQFLCNLRPQYRGGADLNIRPALDLYALMNE